MTEKKKDWLKEKQIDFLVSGSRFKNIFQNQQILFYFWLINSDLYTMLRTKSRINALNTMRYQRFNLFSKTKILKNKSSEIFISELKNNSFLNSQFHRSTQTNFAKIDQE